MGSFPDARNNGCPKTENTTWIISIFTRYQKPNDDKWKLSKIVLDIATSPSCLKITSMRQLGELSIRQNNLSFRPANHDTHEQEQSSLATELYEQRLKN